MDTSQQPPSQIESGFFHAFGGCFGIIAAMLVILLGIGLSCVYWAYDAYQRETIEKQQRKAIEQQLERR